MQMPPSGAPSTAGAPSATEEPPEPLDPSAAGSLLVGEVTAPPQAESAIAIAVTRSARRRRRTAHEMWSIVMSAAAKQTPHHGDAAKRHSAIERASCLVARS